MTPFLVFGLPRSRTFWLSRFLSYGEYRCGHEELRHMRSLDDARLWLSQDFTGTAETAAARWWRLAIHFRPDIKILVVRRPVDDVIESLMALDLSGICQFDRRILRAQIVRMDRALDRIEKEEGVLSVSFSDLVHENVCRKVFEHCLPYEHDREWWGSLATENLQTDMRSLMRYALTYRAQMLRTGLICRHQMRKVLQVRKPKESLPDTDGIVIQEESLEMVLRDGKALFAEHCAAVDEPEDEFLRKNWPFIAKLEQSGAVQIMTARCNGRMFGYLASIIGPSLEATNRVTATQTVFYAAKDAKGMNLGIRLQKASISALRERGVTEIVMRAGVRGAGPKMGALYRRLGASDYGQLYKLQLERA